MAEDRPFFQVLLALTLVETGDLESAAQLLASLDPKEPPPTADVDLHHVVDLLIQYKRAGNADIKDRLSQLEQEFSERAPARLAVRRYLRRLQASHP
jgi:hypothetical protein